MEMWIVSVGEPLPVDGKEVRLRRMGNLAMYAAQNKVDVNWFSVSFDHYKKQQRCSEDTAFDINQRFKLNLAYVGGYRKNVSFARIKHHKQAGRKILAYMEQVYLQKKPDVIIASMEPLEVSQAAVQFAAEHHIPIVVDVRDLWPEIYYDVIPRCLHWALDVYVRKCKKTLHGTLSRCDAIIGLSEGFLQYGLRYAGRERRQNDGVYPIAYPNYDYASYSPKFQQCWGSFGL